MIENQSSISDSPAIKFANVCIHDSKNARYERIKEFVESRKTTLPFTPYMGYFKDEDIPKLEKAAEYFDLNFLIPVQQNNTAEYRFIILVHKIVYSKNSFFHFNPIEKIPLSKRILKNNNKSEWNDPSIFLANEDFNFNKFMFPKKCALRDLPFEIKLQLGTYFENKEEETLFMEQFVDNLQSELDENDESWHECNFTRFDENEIIENVAA